MHWREIIHEYLAAGAKDAIEGLLRSKERRQNRFLQKVGTPELLERLVDWNFRSLQSQRERSSALPSTNQYVLTEESDERITVEVEGARSPMSIDTHRFRLLRDGDSWRLDEIYWKCLCDNGLCSFCHGKPVCFLCKGQGKLRRRWSLRAPPCGLCNGSGQCKHCEGTGKCHYCRDSEMPGWKSFTNYSSFFSE